jgi:23S rRNA (guanosine2251-2'-O)-methyltransferase
MAGGVSSLNVSAAGAVVLYEAARQRRASRFATESVQKSAGYSASVVRKAAPRSGPKGLGS